MEKKQMVGTKKVPGLDSALDQNQNQLVDALITPHVRLPERHGGHYKIVAAYPAQVVDVQPTQAQGRIVWNQAYSFQPHGPTFLDPLPDPAWSQYPARGSS